MTLNVTLTLINSTHTVNTVKHSIAVHIIYFCYFVLFYFFPFKGVVLAVVSHGGLLLATKRMTPGDLVSFLATAQIIQR